LATSPVPELKRTRFWLLLATFGYFWLLLANFGHFWPLLAISKVQKRCKMSLDFKRNDYFTSNSGEIDERYSTIFSAQS
jgi:hypothetical protein